MSVYLVDVEREDRIVGSRIEASRAEIGPDGQLLFKTDEEIVAGFNKFEWRMFSRKS